MRRTFSFDGWGINGPDQYRERLATFTEAGHALPGLGKLLEAAPEMRGILAEVMAPFDHISDENLLLDWQRQARAILLDTKGAA